MKKSHLFCSILLLFCALLQGCGLAATRPKLEMSMAASAFLASKKAKAHTHAPALFRKAEIYFIRAKSAYRRKSFKKAKEFALECQKYSERAEFTAIKQALIDAENPE